MSLLLEQVDEYESEIIKIRRKIHSNPELAYAESETAQLVANRLRALGVKTLTGVGGTGVLGVLKGSRAGKVVGLRADMDALPVEEMVDVPFKSKNKGIMHACGHDAHVAMLLGAAMLLTKNRNQLSGTVKFFFQPAEEDGARGGAKPMIEAGVMTNPTVNYVFGLHIVPNFPSKTFASREGPLMAAPDVFEIKIHGKGGHGSAPNLTVDPIYVAAQVINALQAISSRMLDQIQPFVLSVCNLHSGSSHNIIPNDATLEGTIRTLDQKIRIKAKKDIIQICKMISKTCGAQCEVRFKPDTYPVTVNNQKVTERVAKSLKEIQGTHTVRCDPVLASEDFSRFLQKAPGTFYFLGTGNPRKQCIYPNHSPQFQVDEDVLKYGSVSLAKLAMEFAAK